MQTTADEFAAAVGAEAAAALRDCADVIRHCLGQLTDEQVWKREAEDRNSIGNLILHLCGNIRQWLVSGVGGAKDVRDRPREFSERGPIAKAELLKRLEAVVSEASTALFAVTADQLLRTRRIQGFEVSGRERVMHFCTPRDGTESAQMRGAMAKAGSERPFEPSRRRRRANSVPPSVVRKRPVCVVAAPQRLVLLSRFVASPSLRAFCGPSRGMQKCITRSSAIFSAVPHFSGHTQEIVHITRDLLGSGYRFHWAPAGPEQGAAR